MTRGLIQKQNVSDAKLEALRRLRREMTPAETLLWNALRRKSLAGLKFRRQHFIRGFVADFYCHSLKLVVELDGEIHERQRGADAERDQIFEGLGIKVLRFRNDEVLRRCAGVLHVIEQFAAINAPLPPDPPLLARPLALPGEGGV